MSLEKMAGWSFLVVDDEPDNVEIVADTLTYHGLEVRTASNGVEGMALLDSFTPSLILLDLSMPEMDGWAMRQKVKDNPATAAIPIVALSAHAMAGDKERILAAGFDGYLSKPVNLLSLLEDIWTALEEQGNAPE
jgi:CheY-like chemotaxis protein